MAKQMSQARRTRLEAQGWQTGSAYEFLELSSEERAFVETKLALARTLRERRQRQRLTQSDLAERLGSSQSRIAKMEAGDPSVSIDLLMRGLLQLGASRNDLARAITPRNPRAA